MSEMAATSNPASTDKLLQEPSPTEANVETCETFVVENSESTPVENAPPPVPEIKTEQINENSASPAASAADVVDPLFGRTGSVSIQDEDLDDVKIVKTSLRKVSSKHKAGPQKKTASKIAEITKHLQTPLEKDTNVMVDCAYFAQNGSATVDEKSHEYSHVLKLRSEMPFHLVKSIVLDSGPYNRHVALIIRQKTPFPLLDLPQHIRTKIFNFLLKHDELAIPIVIKTGSRASWSPSYHAPNMLAILRTSSQLHTEIAPIVYSQAFSFAGTQVASDFLLRIGRNRQHLRSLRSETYATQSARMMFQLLNEARNLQRLSFAHVSSSESPKAAVKNIWKNAGDWLMGLERGNLVKGLDVLSFDEKAFHVREKDKKTGGYRVTKWGATEQLEFLKALRAKMIAEGSRLKNLE